MNESSLEELKEKQQIFNTIQSHIVEIIPDLSSHSFVDTELFRDLVDDSMERAAILTRTIESFSLRVPLATFFGPKDFKALIELIFKLMHRP
ncbi:acyl carrier protein [Chitinophaga sp. Mgbs1]|uniref:Acyl carrier protein n=1 Tax=Chitinophaga solisilvae TaxID=1233460 RepID=A0A3S1AZK4_9BACT|nr:acyl carrier protein [Chitinophaga solisilvae]